MKKLLYILSLPETWIALFGLVVAFGTLLFPSSADARAGGGTSVGRASSFSMPSRPSSVPRAPSFSAPTKPPTYTPTPAPSYRPTPPTPITTPSGGSGSSNFWSGFAGGAAGSVVGNWLSSPSGHAGTTIVNSGGMAPAAVAGGGTTLAGGQPGPVIIQEAGTSAVWAWLGAALFLAVLSIIGVFLFGAWKAWRQSKAQEASAAQTPVFDDPLEVFYKIQQAVKDKSAEKLIQLCSAGLASTFLNTPQTSMSAKEALTGVRWWYTDPESDGIENSRGILEIDFQFTDNESASPHAHETWVFQYGRLVGIDVH
jgi:hypothetical protein